MKTFREDSRPKHARKRPSKPSYKRWKMEKLLVAVRKYIDDLKVNYVTAEEISTLLCAKKHLVTQAFHLLRLKGVLGEKYDRPPHDCNRAKSWCDIGSFSSWCASLWRIVRDDEVEQ